jgi:WD40 repeat protein
LLAVGTEGADSEIAICDVTKAKVLTSLKGHGERVQSLAFSPDGKFLVSSGVDGVVRVRDVATWRTVRELALRRDLTTFAMSPSKDERIVAVANGEDDLLIWNYGSGGRARKLVGQVQAIASMAFSPNGRLLITGGSCITSVPPGEPRKHPLPADGSTQVLVWDVRAGKVLSSVPSHTTDVRGLAYSPTDSVFATADFLTGALRLWRYRGEGAMNEQETKKTQK